VSSFELLHPALQYHIVNSLGWRELRQTQLDAIAPVSSGESCLLLAPTAGGKTEAATFPVLSRMLQDEWRGLSVLYVCPIKALLNNLEPRLSSYAALIGRRVAVWHGDIADSIKRRLRTDPPDILLTTPESLEGMLISTRTERSELFSRLKAVVVDELHAFAGDDRSWHLRAVLARLDHYTATPLQRIGLSATVGNPESLLEWLSLGREGQIVGSSSVSTDADVTIDHVGSVENASIVLSRLYRGEKRLVFCDSRALAERLGHALMEAGVRTWVSHASLSASERKAAEHAFAEGSDCVIVATSTLELGIDVGDLDRVIQIESPGTVSSFLQRMGRSGRRSGTRRNFLFLTLTDMGFLQALGITQLWAKAWVEHIEPPPLPFNVLAQQALLLTLERCQLTQHELLRSLEAIFPELAAEDVCACVEHLMAEDYLAQADGVLQIGLRSEREFGGGHYRDLLATFSGADLLLGRWGSQEIGFIDPAALPSAAENRTVLLGGRNWKVTGIDFSRRLATLEPTSERGTARWLGGSASMTRELAQGIREAISDGASPAVRLSKRAEAVLETLRDELPTAENPYPIQELDKGRFRMWTYAGSKRNRSLLAALRTSGALRAEGLYVDFAGRPPELRSDELPGLPRPSDALVDGYAESLKFGDLISPTLRRMEAVSRSFGAPNERIDN
jgi:ATP-dependent Lhr-like helicase